MMIPQFMSFYGYSVNSTLNEYARTFFALINAMNCINAEKSLMNITEISTSLNGDKQTVDNLVKQSKGISGIVNEVRIAKEAKDVG